MRARLSSLSVVRLARELAAADVGAHRRSLAWKQSAIWTAPGNISAATFQILRAPSPMVTRRRARWNPRRSASLRMRRARVYGSRSVARLALVYSLAGDPQASIGQLESLRADGSDELAVLYSLSSAYTQAGRLEEAQSVVEETFQRYPDAPELRFMLSKALEAQGQNERSLDEVDLALAAKPDLPSARFHRGKLLWNLRRDEEAEADFDQAIATTPENAEIYIYRGSVRERRGRGKESEADFRRAMELAPDDYRSYHQLGRLLYRQGNAADALPLLEKALDLKSDHTESHYLLGRTRPSGLAGSMARLTWFGTNWKARHALRGRRCLQVVSPGGNGERVVHQHLHRQGR